MGFFNFRKGPYRPSVEVFTLSQYRAGGLFRGLIYQVKYGAVIGLKKLIAWKFLLGTYKKTRFSANPSAVFYLVHQTTEFRQTTV
jgi:hypothetical protein